MNRIVQSHITEELTDGFESDHPFDRASEHSPKGRRSRLVSWLAGVICIFGVIYGTSYLALYTLPPYEGIDMRSQLTADYRAWAFLVFQPLDPAIIEKIRQEEGLPDQIITDGSSWSTPASIFTIPATASSLATSTPQATFDNITLSPAAVQPLNTSTPVPTSILSHQESTGTPQPSAAANPTKSRKPAKTSKPDKPPKPDKPSKP